MNKGHFSKKIKQDQEIFYNPKNVCSLFKNKTVEQLKNICFNSNLKFSVCTLSVYGNLNVGTIMRTSQLCGVNKYLIFGRKRYNKTSTCGAHHYVNIVACEAIDKKYIDKDIYKLDPYIFYNTMLEHNLVPVFIEQEKNSILLSNINWNKQLKPIIKENKEICFVFGNEGDGIPKDILNIGKKINGSFVITISQLGVSKSFNVSASAAIILYNFKEYMLNKRLNYI